MKKALSHWFWIGALVILGLAVLGIYTFAQQGHWIGWAFAGLLDALSSVKEGYDDYRAAHPSTN